VTFVSSKLDIFAFCYGRFRHNRGQSSKMKIGIDIRTINKPKSGVGYYVTNLLKEFAEVDYNCQYCLISNEGTEEWASINTPKFQNYVTWISNENHIIGDLWESLYLPFFLKNGGVDVFHGPAFMIPLLQKKKVRMVVTIHDIVAYLMPNTVPLKYAKYMQLLIKLVAMRADKIITPSTSTKNDLMNYLNITDSKIQVIHEGVSTKFKPLSSEKDHSYLQKKFGIKNQYMLFIGNLEPRKNIIRLMLAYDQARDKLNGNWQLVICGKKGWLYKEILETYNKLKRNGDIVLTNYVNEVDLLELYRGADIFAFPTLYEGFGLPPLEAMASGVPVLTSNVSSLPEIVGDAALLVDPTSVDQISQGLVKLALSESLRKNLREKGIRQASKFSWKKTAKETMDAYFSVL